MFELGSFHCPIPPKGTPFYMTIGTRWKLIVANGHLNPRQVVKHITCEENCPWFETMLVCYEGETVVGFGFMHRGHEHMELHDISYKSNKLFFGVKVAFRLMESKRMTPSNTLRVWDRKGSDTIFLGSEGFKDLKVFNTFQTMVYTFPPVYGSN